jgi:hypothetical protein
MSPVLVLIALPLTMELITDPAAGKAKLAQVAVGVGVITLTGAMIIRFQKWRERDEK